MARTLAAALRENFLGNSPDWYKQTILGFLILNPILVVYDPFVAGWVLVLEFIFTLAMALKCYPLQPGGLLAVEAILLGLTTPIRRVPVAVIVLQASAGPRDAPVGDLVQRRAEIIVTVMDCCRTRPLRRPIQGFLCSPDQPGAEAFTKTLLEQHLERVRAVALMTFRPGLR